MEDAEVIRAFVSEESRAFAPTLHIEGDCLFFDGWRQTALWVDPEVGPGQTWRATPRTASSRTSASSSTSCSRRPRTTPWMPAPRGYGR